ADHSTGGLTLGAHGQYKWETEVVKGVKATAGTITDELQKTDDLKSVWQRYTNIEFTEENSIKLEQAKKMGDKALLLAVKDIINHASFTGWTTGGHTAIDAQVFAYGQRAKDFYGSQN
ncbi:alkaline phosphatase, partial [Pseudoalteromonas lipolytica]|uniref:alkaline phosphatase n=1 Tax=Pseudoalteromonas lipolytica TaxID=570156 RepID=UPI00241C4C4B